MIAPASVIFKRYVSGFILRYVLYLVLKSSICTGGVDLTEKEYIKTTNRETWIVTGLYLLFFAWWYITAYCFGDDPSQYRYILGFPEWFFYSCIVGYIGISLLLWVVVKRFFTDLPFDKEENGDE